MFTLYNYQTDLINQTRKAISDGYKAPIIVSSTGSGKTIMFAYIAKNAMLKGSRVLIIVHRKEILEQTLKKLYEYGVQCGQIRTGKPMTRDLIQVAMVLTLNNRIDIIKKPDLIICDEGHHFLKTNSFGNVLTKYKDVPKLFFTATPERLSGEGLGVNSQGFCDLMIQGPSINQLVTDGYLTYPILYRPEKEITHTFKIKKGDYDTDEQEKVLSNKIIVGDVISHYRKYFNNGSAVCFCVSINHAKYMARNFEDNNITSMAVYSGMSDVDRKKAFEGLKNGSIKILTNCSLIDEGVDVPDLAGVIMLRKTLSLGKYLQMAGRALRKAEGKKFAIILDHAGNYYLHGHVLADRDWSLDHKKRDRKNDKVPTTTSCPKCYGVWPGTPKECPSCGFIFAEKKEISDQQRKLPKQIEGELIASFPDVDVNDIKNITSTAYRLQSLSPKDRQRAMLAIAYNSSDKRDLKILANAIGYKESWTDYTWKKILKRA
jgi:DNA repair protein RadD